MFKQWQQLIGVLLFLVAVGVRAGGDDVGFQLGMGQHFSFGWGQPEVDSAMMKTGGVASVRESCEWCVVERAKGKLQLTQGYRDYTVAADRLGLAQFNILCYGNPLYDNGDYPGTPETVAGFLRYSEFMVGTMPPGKRVVELWNEWDGGTGMRQDLYGHGDAPRYLKLMKAVAPQLKKLDPGITIVSGGFCSVGFLETLVADGLMDYCDAIALHTYNYHEIMTPDAPEKWHARMLRVEERLKEVSHRKTVDLYISEMGWPTSIGMNSGSSYESSADKLARLYLLARTLPFIKGVWWYVFQDCGWNYRDPEHNFGIVRPDLTPKPGWYVLRDIAGIVKHAAYVGRLDAGDPDIWALHFRQPDGRDVLTLWSGHQDDQWQVVLKNEAAERPVVSVRHAGRVPFDQPWGYFDWVEDQAAGVRQDQLSFTLGNLPMILEGKLDKVKIVRVVKRAFPEKERQAAANIKLPREGAVVTVKGAPAKIYMIDSAAYYHPIRVGVPAKIRFRFNAEYDHDNFYLNLTVDDKIFRQDFTGEETWNGDGLQIAIQTADNSGPGDRTESDIALTKNGPLVFLRCDRFGTPQGVSDKIKVAISRQGDEVTYRLTYPAAFLKVPGFKKGDLLTAALLVNDNDGEGRCGYMFWGDGIGSGKDPNRYNLFLLE
ncbi:MAG: hypothetical protein WC708_12020 [Lentisphaeria bacterium]